MARKENIIIVLVAMVLGSPIIGDKCTEVSVSKNFRNLYIHAHINIHTHVCTVVVNLNITTFILHILDMLTSLKWALE